jgi:alkylation response protein AidB-like acyl-CoA dehydrogenase
MGLHSSPTGELFLDDVRVGRDRLIGETEDVAAGGREGAKTTFMQERAGVAAMALGIVEECLQLSVQYAKDRVQFGKAIGKYQAVSHALVNMRMQVESARLLVRHAVGLLRRGVPCRAEASMAKLAASEALVHVTNQGMQILGGYGYTTEMDMERWFRDGRVTTLMGGSSEIQRNIIAHEMGL